MLRLDSFISIVKKCLDVEVKTGVEQDKINDVILLSFDQMDDATKVSIIMVGLNDEHVNEIIAKEQHTNNLSALENVNQAELLKWRTWIMKTMVIVGSIAVFMAIIIYIALPSSCDQEVTTSILLEIKKYIELLIFNKTE